MKPSCQASIGCIGDPKYFDNVELRKYISNLSKCTIKNNVGDKKQVYGETSDSLLTLLPVRLVYHSFGP